jgi:hypothetical protein
MARTKKTARKPSAQSTSREWLWRALIAAAFSILASLATVVAKEHYESSRRIAAEERSAAAASLGALQELSALLDESYRIFTVQNGQAQRLLRSLQRNHARHLPADAGYDETFYVMHERFTRQEIVLQRLIRSTTMNSQRRVNLAMSQWLQRSPAFLHDTQPDPQRAQLAAQLRMLQLHLNQWHDKYDAWIPGDPKRSLVYLADEEAHGVGFPPGLEEVLREVVAGWGSP